jgi:hypothetical protein
VPCAGENECWKKICSMLEARVRCEMTQEERMIELSYGVSRETKSAVELKSKRCDALLLHILLSL